MHRAGRTANPEPPGAGLTAEERRAILHLALLRDDINTVDHSPRDLVALTVLALLSEGPRHPYDLERLIKERHLEFAMGRTRALYHAVDRLHADGLVEPAETSREGHRPERTVYRITRPGAEELGPWLSDLIVHPVPEHLVFLAAVSFLGCLPPTAAAEALGRRTVALEAWIGALDAASRTLVDRLDLPRLHVIENELQLAMIRAELEWVRRLIADIAGGTLEWPPEDLPKPGAAVGDDVIATRGHTAPPRVTDGRGHPSEEGTR